MNIYKIWQTVNSDYDTYDGAVVIAHSEECARRMHPYGREWDRRTWADSPEQVSVRLLGVAIDGEVARVVCASFNAG